ncbi:transcription factor bHLH162-like [Musa acuminata AAA Group]|uniref:transcription factor bHLH162-like n=1 Tax=Musa acuminata AAA Group TaxID=214697 RepID=UPI0031D070B8
MKMRRGGRADSRMERKTVEKYRRMHMKSLCLQLSSIIPKEHRTTSKNGLTQNDSLDQATSYIKKLEERIENLKQRRLTWAMTETNGVTVGFQLPILEVRHRDMDLEILLISRVSKRFMFHEVINVLEEEGADVVNASFSTVGDKIFHTIHSKAFSSRIGLEASRVSERLKDLVQ